MATGTNGAVRVALVDDYELVLAGVARMFEHYQDRIEIVEIDVRSTVTSDVDVALYDTFAQGEADGPNVGVLLANPHARRVVVYSWAVDQALVDAALQSGAAGYISKASTAAELVDALERIDAGETVVLRPRARGAAVGLDWPGRNEGLTERESEVLALISQGRSNLEIAGLMHLSINSVKSHIRNLYRKIDVVKRTQAVLWAIDHGFRVEHHRIDAWRR